jgi:hypothetical protein
MQSVPSNASNANRTRGVMRFTTVPVYGDLWFACSAATNASATGGYTPDVPTQTLIQTQTLATAANADIVYVGQGHTETIVGAAGMTFSKSGVSYVGLGNGRARPTITFSTSTAAQMIVSGANILFQNIVFDFTGIDAIVAAISVTGADVTFDNCEFICNSATAGVVRGILTAATADRLRITNNRFLGPAVNSGTTTTAQISHEVGVDYVFQNNYHCGKMTQAILNATTNLRGLIDNNRFVVATGTVAITMAAASTPFITNNRINVASGMAPIVAAAGFVAGNVYSAAAGVTAGTASTI